MHPHEAVQWTGQATTAANSFQLMSLPKICSPVLKFYNALKRLCVFPSPDFVILVFLCQDACLLPYRLIHTFRDIDFLVDFICSIMCTISMFFQTQNQACQQLIDEVDK